MEIDRNTHREAFEAFAEKVVDLESVERIVLFGSVARGSHGVNSDVDVLVEVRDLSQADIIEEKAFSTASDKGVSITPIIKAESEDTSFRRKVEKEGIEYVRG